MLSWSRSSADLLHVVIRLCLMQNTSEMFTFYCLFTTDTNCFTLRESSTLEYLLSEEWIRLIGCISFLNTFTKNNPENGRQSPWSISQWCFHRGRLDAIDRRSWYFSETNLWSSSSVRPKFCTYIWSSNRKISFDCLYCVIQRDLLQLHWWMKIPCKNIFERPYTWIFIFGYIWTSVFFSENQKIDSGEIWTINLKIICQMLYNWTTGLVEVLCKKVAYNRKS